MTNQKPRLDPGDAIVWLDTLIQANEADILEILENALWYLSNYAEGEHTMGTEELLERLRGAIARSKGQVLDKEIDLSIGDVSIGDEDEDEL